MNSRYPTWAQVEMFYLATVGHLYSRRVLNPRQVRGMMLRTFKDTCFWPVESPGM